MDERTRQTKEKIAEVDFEYYKERFDRILTKRYAKLKQSLDQSAETTELVNRLTPSAFKEIDKKDPSAALLLFAYSDHFSTTSMLQLDTLLLQFILAVLSDLLSRIEPTREKVKTLRRQMKKLSPMIAQLDQIAKQSVRSEAKPTKADINELIWSRWKGRGLI
jgi:hypothetical protein